MASTLPFEWAALKLKLSIAMNLCGEPVTQILSEI
jgi:hypothetical protein